MAECRALGAILCLCYKPWGSSSAEEIPGMISLLLRTGDHLAGGDMGLINSAGKGRSGKSHPALDPTGWTGTYWGALWLPFCPCTQISLHGAWMGHSRDVAAMLTRDTATHPHSQHGRSWGLQSFNSVFQQNNLYFRFFPSWYKEEAGT